MDHEVGIMKLNIFRILPDEVEALRDRLNLLGMEVIHEEDAGWRSQFFFLEDDERQPVKWLYTYRPFFEDRNFPGGIGYSAVYLFDSGDICFAVTHGIAHFYVRPFCDYDFGIDLAKRIADEYDVKQMASKRYQGIRTKEIRSYAANTRLDVQSGESIDFIQAAIIPSKVTTYGKSGKFGTSSQLNPKIRLEEIGSFLSAIKTELQRAEQFKLPSTVIIKESTQVEYFDQLLVKEIRSPGGTTDFTRNSFDLCGVDFMFGNEGTFILKAPWKPSKEYDTLSSGDLREYIAEQSLADNEVLKIRVTHCDADGVTRTEKLKESLDYIADSHRVVLASGKWMHFNEDYLDNLDDFVRGIDTEETEDDFKNISLGETAFNASQMIRKAGYENADRNFDIFRTRTSTPIEAWDLRKGDTVYALKFGPAQKLGYVCDQASNLLRLFSNRAGVKEIPQFNRYCLWLGYEAKRLPANIAETNSIILKQKIESWARLCTDLRITPVIKISRRVK